MTGKEIRKRRKALGLTLPEAGVGSGVSQSTWSRWERGVSNPHPLLAGQICDFLDKQEKRRDRIEKGGSDGKS